MENLAEKQIMAPNHDLPSNNAPTLKKLSTQNMNRDYFLSWLNRASTLTSSELQLSAVLAGFSLGAVVAILFIEKSPAVNAMFVLSITASWVLIISTIYHQFILNGIQDMVTYLDQFDLPGEVQTRCKKIDKNSLIASFLFLVGLLIFSAVLITASFTHSVLFGVITLAMFGLSFVFVLVKGGSLSIEGDVLDNP